MAGNNYRRKSGRNRYTKTPNRRPNADMSSSAKESAFARDLLSQPLINPNVRTSNKTITYSLYTREDIISYLQSPTTLSNQKNLRKASQYMYVASMHYQRLIKYYAGLYKGSYIISPVAFQKNGTNQNQITKQYYKVAKALETLKIPALLRRIINVALKDGAYYGILVADNNSAMVYPIDPDYCIITSIVDDCFVFSVDVTQIARYLEFYPQEFERLYSEYERTGERYQELSPEICFCIKADSSILDYTLPPFAAVLPSIYTIANMESLEETSEELKNYKMLAGQIPVDDKGAPLMDDKMVNKFYKHIANALGDRVGLALSPFDLQALSFERKDSDDVDAVAEATTNFWSAAGTSGLLHGKDNDTAGVIKLAVKNDETFVLDIINQFETVVNRYLKMAFSGTTKFRIEMEPLTIFNEEDMISEYRQSATLGLGKSHYAAAMQIPPYDIAGLDYLEKNVLGMDDLTPLQSSYNTSSSNSDGGETSEAGRPAEKDTDLEEEGVATKENDTNANR